MALGMFSVCEQFLFALGQSAAAATASKRKHHIQSLRVLRKRIGHQHDVHRDRARRCRGDRKTARRARNYPTDDAGSVQRFARRSHAFYPKHKSGRDRRQRSSGHSVKNREVNENELRSTTPILVDSFSRGLALLAVAASATTLSRLKLEDLAQESTAVARLRCLGATSQWEQGEIWTETRFEVLQREKGALPGIVTVRLHGRKRRTSSFPCG